MFVLDDTGATLIGIAVVLFGYVVFGLTGFGASLFTVPVLSHFYPLPLVLALAALLDLAGAITVGVHGRREAALQELTLLTLRGIVRRVEGQSFARARARGPNA